MKRLGVIGGLGPMATAYFMQMIVEMTDSKCDQEHIEMIIFNCPSIPDRTNFILKRSAENPYSKMFKIGKQLADYGVDIIAIPCVTATYFEEKLERDLQVPIINIIKETVRHLKENQIKSVGLMATDGTIESNLFQKEFNDAGIDVLIPERNEQKKVMSIIYNNVKAGVAVNMDDFMCVAQSLKSGGGRSSCFGVYRVINGTARL